MLALAVAACGGGGGTSAERFCRETQENRDAIVTPLLDTDANVDELLRLYRRLADVAPPAIEDEWAMLVRNVETASTVVPDDPESVQRVMTQAFATERSAVAVRDWVLANCAVDLGPVSTITPHGPVSVPTVPPTDGAG